MAAAPCNLVRLPFVASPSSGTTSPNRRLLSASLCSNTLSFRSSFHWPNPVSATELVVDPAVRHANGFFCRSGCNVQVVVGEDEPEEALLRRFRREVSKAGVIQECKRRKFFESKHEEKKRKAREAGRRNRRRGRGRRFSSFSSSIGEASPKEAKDDVDDNWEMPEGGLL